MPIAPENKHRYPANWKDIRAAIMERAGGRCECTGECGLHRNRRCVERHQEKAAWARGKVCLTTAHLDHQPEHNDPSNLKAMCNRCHLVYDRDHHRQSRDIRRDRKAGQGKLFEECPTAGPSTVGGTTSVGVSQSARPRVARIRRTGLKSG